MSYLFAVVRPPGIGSSGGLVRWTHQEPIMFQSLTRKSIVAVASLSLAAGACWTVVRADEPKMMEDKKMMMSPEDSKMCTDECMKVKEMAADPQKAETMTADVAKMMVMEHMAKMMAMDPAFQKSAKELMADPAMIKIRDDAKKMAEDPDSMKKIKEEVMADPKAKMMVMHQAVMMTMMHDKMGMDGDKMKDMAGQMKTEMEKK
jgi:hypothetical protein